MGRSTTMRRTSPLPPATTTTPRTATTTTAGVARRPWNSPREDTQRPAGHGLRVRREPKSTLSISVPFALGKARTLPKASALGPPFSEPPLHESYCLQRVRGRRRTSQSGGLRASHPGQAREFLLAECTRIAVLGVRKPSSHAAHDVARLDGPGVVKGERLLHSRAKSLDIV